MYIDTKEALERYGCASATLYNKRKRIEELDGIIVSDVKGTGNLYKTSVLDRMALSGELGTEAKKRILNKRIDHENQQKK